MNRNQSILFRIILLLAGFGIVALAAYLLNGEYVRMTWGQRYTWISVLLMYAAVFVPAFFPPSLKTNNAGKISAYGITWIFIIIYLCASAGLLIYVNSHVYEQNYVIIVQCVLLFGVAIGIYLSCLVTGHTASVEVSEKQSISLIQSLRDTSSVLVLTADQLGSDNDDVKKKIQKIADDLRYLSPADTPEASALEQKIMAGLGDIGVSSVLRGEGGSAAELKQRIDSVQFLINQRKLFFNR